MDSPEGARPSPDGRNSEGRFRGFLAATLVLWALWSWPPPAAEAAPPVALELVLAVDVSASVDAGEYALQIGGLTRAFLDPEVQDAIAALNGDLLVALVQWAGSWQQVRSTGWWRVRDVATAQDFAAALATSPRLFVGEATSLSAALRQGAALFETNGAQGRRRILDIAGDGRNNSGVHPSVARDELIAQGITVNGLAILDGDAGLGAYFEDHVAGGTASFVVTAVDFSDFARAIREKLLRELPNPLAGDFGSPRQSAARE